MNNKTAYPLSWPLGWPRTESHRREHAKFKTTLPAALAQLETEIRRMGGKNVILSSNYTLGISNPSDPGVVAYFDWKPDPFKADFVQMAIPCDRWTRIEHNIKAIALTIEAMRGMERWGAKHMIKAMFSGFKSLPEKASGIDPWEVLGIAPTTSEVAITDAYRFKATTEHPDAGGTTERFQRLQEAHELAMATIRK